MFSVEQISAAHGRVKSGADFPAYIQAIKTLGVKWYEAYVSDGHIDYHGLNGYTVKVPAKYSPVPIAGSSDAPGFRRELTDHQAGKTDFLTFIKACADLGIEKWQICLDEMTCTYYDMAGSKVLVEKIPH